MFLHSRRFFKSKSEGVDHKQELRSVDAVSLAELDSDDEQDK